MHGNNPLFTVTGSMPVDMAKNLFTTYVADPVSVFNNHKTSMFLFFTPYSLKSDPISNYCLSCDDNVVRNLFMINSWLLWMSNVTFNGMPNLYGMPNSLTDSHVYIVAGNGVRWHVMESQCESLITCVTPGLNFIKL